MVNTVTGEAIEIGADGMLLFAGEEVSQSNVLLALDNGIGCVVPDAIEDVSNGGVPTRVGEIH